MYRSYSPVGVGLGAVTGGLIGGAVAGPVGFGLGALGGGLIGGAALSNVGYGYY